MFYLVLMFSDNYVFLESWGGSNLEIGENYCAELVREKGAAVME